MDRVETEQKYYLEDGRMAEKHVVDTGKTRVTEIYEEVEKPKSLSQRVTEKLRPAVYERKIETIDENGDVVDVRIETVESEALVPQPVEHMTREEMVSVVSELIDAVNSGDEERIVTSYQAVVGERVATTKPTKNKILDWTLYGVIAAELVGLGYLLWPKLLGLVAAL